MLAGIHDDALPEIVAYAILAHKEYNIIHHVSIATCIYICACSVYVFSALIYRLL